MTSLKKYGFDFVLGGEDDTGKAFASVNRRIKQLADNTESIAKVSKVGFALFVGGKLLEGVRKLAGAMFDVNNATNKIDAQRLQGMHNAMGKAKEAFGGVAATIGSKLAPILEAVANWFVKLIGDGEGFREKFGAVFAGVTRAVGVFADAWRGVEVIWEVLKLAFYGFRLALVTGLQEIDKLIVDVANKLPGVNLRYSAGLEGASKGARNLVAETKGNLHDLMTKPLPSAMMKSALAQFDQMKGAAVALTKEQEKVRGEAAKALAKERERQDKELDDLVGSAFDKVQKENDQLAASMDSLRKQGQSKLQALEEQRAAERASIQSARIRDITDEDTARQLELESLARYNEQKELLQKEADDKKQAARMKELGQFQWMEKIKQDFELKSIKGRIAGVQGLLGMAANLMQSSKKKEFEFGKKAAEANAYLSMFEGIGKAWEYGPILGSIYAGLVFTNAMMNIRSIKSQQFGGGGAANVGATPVMSVDATGSASGSGAIQEAPTLPMSSQSGGPERQTIVKVDTGGNAFLDAWIRDRLAPAMREAYGDGVQFMTV